MFGGVYSIEIKGMKYIGRTNDLKSRKRKHLEDLRKGNYYIDDNELD